MCGIYGILALRPGARASAAELRRMAGVTIHRGPDDEGEYQDDWLAMGMRRLSILDLAGGHQPIPNEDGSILVVCNGEIYNYRELGESLRAVGHQFRSQSDSEVLVHLYEQHGDAFVAQLNGMFAFALWDLRRRRLLLGRDRLGIKPLYYRDSGPQLAFSSEAKAILAVMETRPDIDPAAVRDYLALGYVPAPRSMFKGIQKLPPASLLASERGKTVITRYWTPAAQCDDTGSEEEWAETVLDTLDKAVRSQMVSDVPLGAFLSGGIDSSTVVALMARHSTEPVKTYSIGFDTAAGAGYYNELPWAQTIATRFRTDHREILVRPDIARLLPKLLWHMDEPVADSAFITTYLVAEFARQDVTVILSGVGGDELFGGYRRYLGDYYDRYYRFATPWLRRNVLQPLARMLPSDRHSRLMNLSRQLRAYVLSHDGSFEDRYRTYVQVFARASVEALLRDGTAQSLDALDAAFGETADGDALSRMMRVDLLTQLPDDLLTLTDRMTMATSLECRVPFLDNTVIDLSLRMPSRFKIRGRRLKHILKRAVGDLLPAEILDRGKRGFGAPVGAWFKHDLAPLVRTVLSRDSVEKRGLFRWDAVQRTISLHEANREDYTDHLLALTNFELWSRVYLDGEAPGEVEAELVAGRSR
ncbi:MAG: asparagine synthase (glutamine-hydrolyzing) [Candidatus Rokuibacteriota bacterium]